MVTRDRNQAKAVWDLILSKNKNKRKPQTQELDQLMVRSDKIRLNLKTYKVDIDELPEIADKYNVKSLK